MSIQITMLLFVTTTLLAASAINANSTRRYDDETTEVTHYSGNATTPSPTADSLINGTTAPRRNRTDAPFYYTTPQTSTGNISYINDTTAPTINKTDSPFYLNNSTTSSSTGHTAIINGTSAPRRNRTYVPFHYNTTTTPQTPIGNISSTILLTPAQPESPSSFDQEIGRTIEEYNGKKAAMENGFNSMLKRNQFSKFMTNFSDVNDASNNTKNKFEPEFITEHQTTTPRFSYNQTLNETANSAKKQYPNSISMSKIPDMTYDIGQPGSEAILELFKGNTTMEDLVMIASVLDSVQFKGTTDITNSGHKEMEKHEQKVYRKTYTYTEEEIVTQE